MASTPFRSQFSDEIIKATALNRKPGAILNKASRNPVTIVRNNESFALLNRNLFAGLVTEANQAGKVLDLFYAAIQALYGESPTVESPYGWLSAYDSVEIRGLVAEVLRAFHNAPFVNDGWEQLEATIHKWHERAIAFLSNNLDDAFSSESNKV